MQTYYILIKTIRDNPDGFPRPSQRNTRNIIEVTKDEAREICVKHGKSLRNLSSKFGIDWSTTDHRGLRIDYNLKKHEFSYFNSACVQYATEAVKKQRETYGREK